MSTTGRSVEIGNSTGYLWLGVGKGVTANGEEGFLKRWKCSKIGLYWVHNSVNLLKTSFNCTLKMNEFYGMKLYHDKTV